MKSTRLFATALFTFLSLSIFAQINLGLRSGVNFSTVHATEALASITPEYRYVTTAQVAAVAEFEFGEFFSLQPELAYLKKGFGIKEGIDIDLYNIPIPLGFEAISRFGYLEMPILAKGKLGNEKVKAFALAGPTLGYATDGKLTTRATAFFSFDIDESKIDLDAINYERFEIGGIVGAGMEIMLPVGKIMFDGRYQMGFTEIYDIPVFNEKLMNRNFQINVGYVMPL